jgi:hypothetical protein
VDTRAGQDSRYTAAAAEFGGAIERLARGYGPVIVTVGPAVFGLLLTTAGLAHMKFSRDALPVVGLVGVWFVALMILVRIRRRRLKAQIDELDAQRGD